MPAYDNLFLKSPTAGLEVIPTDISREAQASLPAMEDMSFSKVEAPKDPAPHGRTPLVDAAAKGDCKVFCDVLSAMEDNLTKHQVRVPPRLRYDFRASAFQQHVKPCGFRA